MDFKLTESSYQLETKDKKYNPTIEEDNKLSVVETDKISKDTYYTIVAMDKDEFIMVMSAVINLIKSLNK